MYCSSCGIEIPDSSRYCSHCGAATAASSSWSTTVPRQVLRRSRTDKKIAGVCAGIARYMGVDVTLVRILMLVLALCPPGTGIIAYIVCWIVMPLDPILVPPPDQSTAQTATAQS